MIQLLQQPFGYEIHLEGLITRAMAQDFALELDDELAGISQDFSFSVDARGLIHFEPEASVAFEEALDRARAHGLRRMAVLSASTAHAPEFFQMADRIGLAGQYRYLDRAPSSAEELLRWLAPAAS
jgi:hypothetical protein